MSRSTFSGKKNAEYKMYEKMYEQMYKIYKMLKKSQKSPSFGMEVNNK